MERAEETKIVLRSYCENHPFLQIEDLFKFIYQSAFGCSHAVCSVKSAVEGIIRENAACDGGTPKTEMLDGDFCRVSLGFLSPKTLGKLFFLSAKPAPQGETLLREKLSVARSLIGGGLLPFSEKAFEDAAEKWEADGFPALHHSAVYKEKYAPSYRVISKEFARYIPLFCELDRRLQQGSVTMCIEGGSASGKTTLAKLLSEIYDAAVFHADDFFLPPAMRTPSRLAATGGNLDRERLEAEVLKPLLCGDTVNYRKFDCQTGTLLEPFPQKPARLNIIEGVYSNHPEISKYYNFSLFLDIAKEEQQKRIEKRNSPEFAKRFFDEWIPLEDRYFTETNIKNRCDLILFKD